MGCVGTLAVGARYPIDGKQQQRRRLVGCRRELGGACLHLTILPAAAQCRISLTLPSGRRRSIGQFMRIKVEDARLTYRIEVKPHDIGAGALAMHECRPRANRIERASRLESEGGTYARAG